MTQPLLRRFALCLAICFGSAAPGLAAPESPLLAPMVEAGSLAPVADRLPKEPLVADLAARNREAGTQGGTLRMIFTKPKDIRYMVVYGYARLVGYDAAYNIQPDILREVEVEAERIFTLHLREGHRWSDGQPFTTEDFRYWWEDVANDPDLSPSGPPEFMLVDGLPPTVTVLSPTAIRFEWAAPNPRFLSELAQARDPFIYRPAHYLRAYHNRYGDVAAMEAMIAELKVRNWAQLHNNFDEMYNFDNPDLPTLQPWVNTTSRNGERYVLHRNPYFHRVDPNGVQLPYIDTVEITIAAAGLVASKVTLGEADLQVRSLSFADAPVLKKGEASGAYKTLLWQSGAASEIALYPNLNYVDPAFQALFRDARFRQALSLAVDRTAINKSLYFGMAKERGVAALEASPFFDEAQATAFATHDAAQANAILDSLGLDKRAADGTRLLPDGRPLEIVIESAGERTEEADALELVAESWRECGIKLIYRPVDRDILRDAAYQGTAMMPVWYGWDNGIPTPDAPPTALAPVDQANFNWPMWGQHYQTKGTAGLAPDVAEAAELLSLYTDWTRSATTDERAGIWRKMLAIHADQVYAIGLVAAAPQPIAVSTRLRNVPETAIYAWDPGSHLGVHRMDEFYFAD